ncbi:proteolipid protein 2 isoform X2 [Hypomesus transpacificus]|uniref:proteolipid protein 2 isoform X2 n=1 Tax=Hypomesus transpacificus TaxID=137520 RepID=UPI001F086261|nr:proteolipid protein 2 isoform X2 [Hypomesus transpacificus]
MSGQVSSSAPSPSSPTSVCNIEIDLAFLKSNRGCLKLAEMVMAFVAFVCFAVASPPVYMAAMAMELLVTLALLLLYLLKLHRKFTLFFWPLVDVFNSVVAACIVLVLSLMAVSTYTVRGMLAGGIVGLLLAGLWSADIYLLSKRITFNQARSQTK